MKEYYNQWFVSTEGEKNKADIYNFITQNHLKDFNEYFDRFLCRVKEDNILIDMSMLSFGSRRKMLNIFSNYEATCDVFYYLIVCYPLETKQD